MKSLDP